jgi:excisionase family DNA binding protein
MRKQAQAAFDGAMLALPELSAAATQFVQQHPQEARVAVTAALEAVAAHFDAALNESRIPESLRPFVDDDSAGATDEDLIGPEEAARRLGVSRATVYNWIDSMRLIGWRLTRQGTLIPAEQILGRGELVPGIDRVLEILPEPRIAWRFLKEESPFFDTPIRPIDALKAGKVDDVVMAARTSGEAFT